MKYVLPVVVFLIGVNSTAFAQATISMPTVQGPIAAAGAAIVAKAASKCLGRLVRCGVVTAAGVGALIYANRKAELALARGQAAIGAPLSPPGYCPENKHSELSAVVNKLCKSTALIRCVRTDSPVELRAKAFAFSQCAKIRAKREDLCYRGGDAGHRQQIQQMWQAHDRCYAFAGLK